MRSVDRRRAAGRVDDSSKRTLHFDYRQRERNHDSGLVEQQLCRADDRGMAFFWPGAESAATPLRSADPPVAGSPTARAAGRHGREMPERPPPVPSPTIRKTPRPKPGPGPIAPGQCLRTEAGFVDASCHLLTFFDTSLPKVLRARGVGERALPRGRARYAARVDAHDRAIAGAGHVSCTSDPSPSVCRPLPWSADAPRHAPRHWMAR